MKEYGLEKVMLPNHDSIAMENGKLILHGHDRNAEPTSIEFAKLEQSTQAWIMTAVARKADLMEERMAVSLMVLAAKMESARSDFVNIKPTAATVHDAAGAGRSSTMSIDRISSAEDGRIMVQAGNTPAVPIENVSFPDRERVVKSAIEVLSKLEGLGNNYDTKETNNAAQQPAVAAYIQERYDEFRQKHGEDPLYAEVTIRFKDDGARQDDIIKLSTDIDERDDDKVFFNVDGIEGLKKLLQANNGVEFEIVNIADTEFYARSLYLDDEHQLNVAQSKKKSLEAIGYPYSNTGVIPTVNESLYWQYAAGIITLKEAAREFARNGWTNFVDEDFTLRQFNKLNQKYHKLADGSLISSATINNHKLNEQMNQQNNTQQLISLSELAAKTPKDRQSDIVFIRDSNQVYTTYGKDADRLAGKVSSSVATMRPEIDGRRYPFATVNSGNIDAVRADLMANNVHPVIIDVEGNRIANDTKLSYTKEERKAFLDSLKPEAKQLQAIGETLQRLGNPDLIAVPRTEVVIPQRFGYREITVEEIKKTKDGTYRAGNAEDGFYPLAKMDVNNLFNINDALQKAYHNIPEVLLSDLMEQVRSGKADVSRGLSDGSYVLTINDEPGNRFYERGFKQFTVRDDFQDKVMQHIDYSNKGVFIKSDPGQVNELVAYAESKLGITDQKGIYPAAEKELKGLVDGQEINFMKIQGKPLRIVNDDFGSDPNYVEWEHAYIKSIAMKDGRVALVGAIDIDGSPLGINSLDDLRPLGVRNLLDGVRHIMENAERLNNNLPNNSTIMAKENQSVSQQEAAQQMASASAGKKVDTKGLGNEAKAIVKLDAVAEKARNTLNFPFPEQSVILVRTKEQGSKNFIYQAFGEDATRLANASRAKAETPEIKGEKFTMTTVREANAKGVIEDLAAAKITATIINRQGEIVKNDRNFKEGAHVAAESKRPEYSLDFTQKVTKEDVSKVDNLKRESGEIIFVRKDSGKENAWSNYAVVGADLEKLHDAVRQSSISEQSKNFILGGLSNKAISDDMQPRFVVTNGANHATILDDVKKALVEAGLTPAVVNTKLQPVNDFQIVPSREETAKWQLEKAYQERADRHTAEKTQNPDSLVLLKMNTTGGQTFYQTFGDDAWRAAELLGKESKVMGGNRYVSLKQDEVDKITSALEKTGEKKPVIVEFINNVAEKIKELFRPELKEEAKVQFDIAKNLHARGIYDIHLIVDDNKVAAHHLTKEDRDAFFKKEISPKELVGKYFEKELSGQTPEVSRVASAKKENEPSVLMETVNGQKVTNARTFTSENGNHFFAAHLDGVALRPQAITKQVKDAFDNGTVPIGRMMETYYPTKVMPKLPIEDFKSPTLSNGKEFSFFRISKDANSESPTAGKYVLDAVVDGKRLKTTPVSYRNLNEFFDGVTSKAQILERTMGEQLHLPAGYEKYRMPEGAMMGQNVQVKIQRDDAQRRFFIAAETGSKELGTKMLSYDDAMSYRAKAASKEQLGAKYFYGEIKSALAMDKPVEQTKTKSLKL